ncbi:hypothetical protein [Paenochrobactrum glaciei]|uniref:DUF3311 domain-containing protein n=1 Tax=Paenochrobactrum glaciei TaxID=486407 RepID=A0ABN1G5N9_9HYPH
MVQNRGHARPPQSDGDKKRDNAVFLLPLFGCVFSLPPMMNLFNHKVLVFGIPLAFLYLLGVWTIMVVIAFFISRKSRKTQAPSPEAEPQNRDLTADQNRPR